LSKPILADPSVAVEAMFEQALALHREGQLAQAEALYRQVRQLQPAHLDALQLLGALAFQTGRYDLAAELLRQAVNMAPEAASLHCNLGLALQQLEQFPAAIACYDSALALHPAFAEALNNKGNALRTLQRAEDAVACFEQALQMRPDFSEASFNLGSTLLELNRPEPALARFADCLNDTPDRFEAHLQSGIAHLQLNQTQAALASFERALQIVPDDAECLYYRGNALLELNRPEDAADSYRKALQLRSDIPELHYNLANALLDLQRPAEALPALQQALALRPDYAAARYNLGGALQDLGRHEEAATVFESLSPDYRYVLGKLFHSRQFCCDWNRHTETREAIVQALHAGQSHDMPFPFLAVSDDPALQLRCARAYTAAKHPAAAVPLWAGERYRHQRIRIAYVSADLRDHAVSNLLAGVFEAHDRKRFEIIAISLRPKDETNPTGRRIAAAFERFIDVSQLSDSEVARLIRELEVDIAVDLTGYTENNRTDIFALRPAPIQVNYLGFPGGMGAEYMDNLLADAFVIPEAARSHYQEQIVYLPDCFQANDDKRQIAEYTPSRAEAGLPDAGFVFCAFNNVYKFTPAMFEVWLHLLQAVPGSVLWLAAETPCVRRNLTAEATRFGVAADRLVFSPRVPYPEHLARMRLADLFLDTLPFNAGTTASDALWAGLPVLTCAGEAFAARMAGSLLQTIGLPELVTCNLAEYEALALELATSPTRLAEIRTKLANNRDTSPLFDTDRFCRNLESAYQGMWDRKMAM
jgi:predicted O-linked N-acetylglucosamine transferase (SPINDLY family)